MARETKPRRIKVIGTTWTNAGIRLVVEDLDTGEKFRWLPWDFIKELMGHEFGGDWTTYNQAGYLIAERKRDTE